jgi:hypothetical protein
MTYRYCVIQTDTDGSSYVWGPFSGHRADQAAAALLEREAVKSARVMPMLSSTDLNAEAPDWRRMVA